MKLGKIRIIPIANAKIIIVLILVNIVKSIFKIHTVDVDINENNKNVRKIPRKIL